MQIQSSDITTIFDVCLERMRRGESIEACLHDYPAEAEELEPLLIAAVYAHNTFRPPSLSPEARQAIQRKLHQAVAARQPVLQRRPRRSFGPMVMRFALALVVALLSLGGGVAAAQTSLPDSFLYPLKRMSEDVRLRLASSPAQRARLHLDFAATRSAEILALVSSEQETVNSSLVDDLDQEYQLAWEEIGQSPADEVPDLVGRYVVERQADVRVFSAALTLANAATRGQIQRAVRLGEQALAIVDPAKGRVPQPTPDHDVNIDGDNSHGNGTPNSDNKTATAGPKATPEAKPTDAGPKATPVGKPTDAGPKATPEAKPTDAGPKATPVGKPTDAGPKATPVGKPTDAGPKATPVGKPTDAGPKVTPEGKPANADPKATPEGEPVDAGPKATPEDKPADAGSQATPEGKPVDTEPQPTPEGQPAEAGPSDKLDDKPDDKPNNSDPKPKPQPKPKPGKP
jgi:hypothetical protein